MEKVVCLINGVASVGYLYVGEWNFLFYFLICSKIKFKWVIDFIVR